MQKDNYKQTSMTLSKKNINNLRHKNRKFGVVNVIFGNKDNAVIMILYVLLLRLR